MTNKPSHRAAILTIILTSYVMIVLDISIVITGLPKIQHGLGFSDTDLSWVQNAYTLAFGGLLLLGARAGDLLGRRRMFIVGLSVFSMASLAIGLAQSAAWLLTARAIQGAGAAVLAPSTLALLSTSFPEGTERTRAFGYYGAAAGIAASVGLVLGGILADWVSWRMGFFINLPIGAALIIGAKRYLQETPSTNGQFDLAGAISSTTGMTALVYGIVRAATAGWIDPLTLAALSAAFVLLIFFVMNEHRAAQPIMPLRLFANRERNGAYAARILFLGGMVGFWFFSTQFLQGVLGFSPAQAGIAFLPATLVNFAAAMAVPRLTARFGNARLLAAGLTISVIGMAWLSQVTVDTNYVFGVAFPMALIGLGQGLSLSPLTVAGMAGVALEDAGAASGFVNVAHQLGGSLGLGVLVVVYSSTSALGFEPHALLAHRIASAFLGSGSMLMIALMIVLAFVLCPKHELAPVKDLA